MANISWHNAALFCNWLTSGSGTSGYYTITGSGDTATASPNALSHAAYAALNGTTYFLPTEEEWYKAAYYSPVGSTYYDYPTDSNTVPTAVYGGTTAGTAVYWADPVNPTAPANVDNSGGLSPYLTMGQGGNVWEWNETLISGSYRGLRGGPFFDAGIFLRSDYRDYYAPTYESNSVGFRVAAIVVPEPGSIGLLAMALAGTVARRRRLAR